MGLNPIFYPMCCSERSKGDTTTGGHVTDFAPLYLQITLPLSCRGIGLLPLMENVRFPSFDSIILRIAPLCLSPKSIF